MEQFDIIGIIFLALAVLVLLMGIVFVIIFYKPIGDDRVQLIDDAPARYEDYEEAFYNP